MSLPNTLSSFLVAVKDRTGYSMPPKKRTSTGSPKKGANVEEFHVEVMEDIDSESNVHEDDTRAAATPSKTTVTRRGRKKKETPQAECSIVQEEIEDAQQPPMDAAPPPLDAIDDGEELEEIITTRDDDEEANERPALVKEENTVYDELAATPTKAKRSVGAAVFVESVTPSRRVPRLKMDHEPSEDVKKAQAIEDQRERQTQPVRKHAVVRRATSPARTRGFTSAATLSATMKESKERLKRTKREVKYEGEAAEGAEEVDVETEDDPVTSGNSAVGNTCGYCGLKFPLQLEMVEHQLSAHKKEARHNRERGGSLLCAHPHCGLSLKDMNHQLAHLAGYHNQIQFRIRQQQFASEEAFMAWKADSEQRAKSNYIARNEELEIESGVTELELYCECSEEWRNADKTKNLSPILACPAHFTVRLDRNKDKVTIIGCTSHLGHLKKMNWSVYEPAEAGASRKATGVTIKQSKCHLCGEWFRSRTSLTIHRRSVHPDNIRTATIACGDPNCDVVTDTMLSLCEHVVDAHKREDLTIEEYRFNSVDDFEVWKERMEADTMSYFTKVSGRQRAAPSGPNSDCFFRYYQCHLSGYNQRPSQKKTPEELDRVKIRNRGTKKMNRFCTAFMNIKINDGDGSVLLKGCLGHFGHECDIRRVPMPNSLRNDIVKLLQQGVTEDDVLELIKQKASQHERAFYLQKYEVKNIVKKMIKESNGAFFYKYDDEEEELGEDDMNSQWQVLKRPFSSTMYRSMIYHPKRVKLGTHALQFSAQVARKRRLVYRQEGDHSMHDGDDDYYESVVEEMAADMDEHVTYLDDEAEMDPSSSHHHMVQEGEGQHEGVPHDDMHDMANEASTSSAHLVRRRKRPTSYRAPLQQQRLMQHAATRMPLLKDGSEHMPITERDQQLEFTIHNIRRKIMYMTEQVKRCKDPHMSAQMLEEVRMLETRMARIIPQTGPGRLDQGLPQPQFARRGEGEEDVEEDRELYYDEMVVDEGEYYEEVDDGRPGPSTMVVPRSQRGYHEVIYQDVGSPGVEVDVEDLEELEVGEDIGQMDQ